MTLSQEIVKRIIIKLLNADDYRIEVVNILNARFLEFAIDFFKKVAAAKLDNKTINKDWYKKHFLSSALSSEDFAINSGLNKKTINNMYGSAAREIVIEASNKHYKDFSRVVNELVKYEGNIDLTLTIKIKGVSIDLNISESLLVINTLAVKRAALRGGLWSTAGKRVERPLMETLCKLYQVPNENYSAKIKKSIKEESEDDFAREVDFFLIAKGQEYKCEVKLMGKGNPESADVIYARFPKVFVADTLSGLNINQLNSNHIGWVELKSDLGFRRFKKVLEDLDIPHRDLKGSLDKQVKKIFSELF